MKSIYKYSLNVIGVQEVELTGKILSVVGQRDQIVLYAVYDPEKPVRKVKVMVVGTGNPLINDNWDFLNTVNVEDGLLMWHIFVESKVFEMKPTC